jgi:uncharacterized membrane protein HdeD (DUF308 family)
MALAPNFSLSFHSAAIGTRHRWSLALRGILALAVGLLALALPGAGLIALVALVVALFTIDGLFSLGLGLWNIRHDRRWWVSVLQGVVSLGLAVVAAMWPSVTVTVLVWLTAAFAIWQGISELMLARVVNHGAGWVVIGGVLSLVLGILMIAVPLLGAVGLVVLFALYAILRGVSLLILAFGRVRQAAI